MAEQLEFDFNKPIEHKKMDIHPDFSRVDPKFRFDKKKYSLKDILDYLDLKHYYKTHTIYGFELGKRYELRIEDVSLINTGSYNMKNSMYKPTYTYELTDPMGNIFEWRTGSYPIPSQFECKGTISYIKYDKERKKTIYSIKNVYFQ